MSKRKIYVNSTNDVPDVPHYAIIKSSSRDDGYGGTTGCVDYVAFLDHAEWEAEVKQLVASKNSYSSSFKAIHVTPAVVKITVDVKVT